jgi:hypothetical protein
MLQLVNQRLESYMQWLCGSDDAPLCHGNHQLLGIEVLESRLAVCQVVLTPESRN